MDEGRRFDTQSAIAFVIVAAFVAVVFVWLMIPPENIAERVMSVVTLIIGALIAKFGTVVDYYFGSNKDSKSKDETIKSMAGTGTGSGLAVAAAAAAAAAPAAAAAAAPAAAEAAAPPVVNAVVPPAVEKAVDEAMAEAAAKKPD